jgi:hypothetical protein
VRRVGRATDDAHDATPQARALKVTAVGDVLAVVRGDSEEHQQG